MEILQVTEKSKAAQAKTAVMTIIDGLNRVSWIRSVS